MTSNLITTRRTGSRSRRHGCGPRGGAGKRPAGQACLMEATCNTLADGILSLKNTEAKLVRRIISAAAHALGSGWISEIAIIRNRDLAVCEILPDPDRARVVLAASLRVPSHHKITPAAND